MTLGPLSCSLNISIASLVCEDIRFDDDLLRTIKRRRCKRSGVRRPVHNLKGRQRPTLDIDVTLVKISRDFARNKSQTMSCNVCASSGGHSILAFD